MVGYFETFSDFLAMGKHGIYVWSCYGLFLAMIIFNLVSIRMKKTSFLKSEKQRMRREEASQADSELAGDNNAS